MAKITRELINNAFIPSKEVVDANLFAGRKMQMQNVLDALYSNGTNIAIIGGRGIGKTSLTRQICNIAEGKNEILEKLNIPHDSKFEFLTIYFACGNNVKTIDDLLSSLLTIEGGLNNWIYSVPEESKTTTQYGGNLSLSVPLPLPLLNIGGSAGGRKISETTSSTVIRTHEINIIFQNVINTIIKQKIAQNGILILIDEYDQIENTQGFAKFLKSLATNTPEVKFCIVGVAQDIQNLMHEHESIDRLFTGGVIKLPYMSADELNEIITNAEKSLRKEIIFDNSARSQMIEFASGHPYLVHLIGRESLKIAHREQIANINKELIIRTIEEIAMNETDPALESRYKKAVSSSLQREMVLKYLASNIQSDGEIPISDIQTEIPDSPSTYVGQLTNEDYGAEIIKIREKYYRFKDSLFAAYAKARPWLNSKK